jgi:uncharacterized protein
MSITLLDLALLAGMAIGFLLIPLGFPGLWVMLACLLGAVLAGTFGLWLLVVLAVLAALAELAEWVFLERLNLKYGGSRWAFWGALAGGTVGVFVGFPVPIIGPVIAGLIGTFLGAVAVTLYETQALRRSAHVGWGVLLGRLWATAGKMLVGIVIFLAGAAVLIFR